MPWCASEAFVGKAGDLRCEFPRVSCPLAASSWTACSVHAVSVAESRCIADLIGPPIVIKRCKNPRTDVRGVSGKAIHGLPRRTHHLSSAMSAGLVICEYRSSGTGPNPTAAQQASLYASVERTSSRTASWFRNGRKLTFRNTTSGKVSAPQPL